MNIAHFNTYLQGGSGVLMLRLHEALGRDGVESAVFYRHGQSAVPGCCKVEYASMAAMNFIERLHFKVERIIASRSRNLYTRSVRPFRTPFPPGSSRPDIMHLHMVAHWLDLPSFLAHMPGNIPLVWTLHDMGSIAGGCYLYEGCDGYQGGCRRCPMLRFPFDRILAAAEVGRKRRSLSGRRVFAVGNSEWTTEKARRSAVFHGAAGFRTIHPAVDTEAFRPIPQSEARARLGLAPDRFTLGFGCAELTDRNKNFPAFVELMERLATRLPVQAVVFGNGDPACTIAAAPIHKLGRMESAADLARAFSAMDVFVMTSRMETFGQVALEAQACGTPVCAYAVGGLPEAVVHGGTGLLCAEGDLGAMAGNILTLTQDRQKLAELGAAGAERTRRCFGLDQALKAYLGVYSTALAGAEKD